MRVAYRYIHPLAVFFARGAGPYETSSCEAWLCIGRWLDNRGVRRLATRGIGVLWDNPSVTDPSIVRYDACVPAVAGLDPDRAMGIERQTLPGGAYAVYTHVGPYQATGDILSSLHREHVPQRNLSPDYDRPFIAIYLNDPKFTREPHRRTELCVPVLPIRMPLASNDDSESRVTDDAHVANLRASPLPREI